MQYGFPKNERLKSRTAFAKLFSDGESAKHYPVRMVYTPWTSDSANGLQAGFSVSKKRFKRAVDRNHIKRHMREAYRLNRTDLPEFNQKLAVLFIYIHHQKSTFADVEAAMIKCLKHLAKADQAHTEV
jgi:ribonuclease P protein component